jgi:hypothetical protein
MQHPAKASQEALAQADVVLLVRLPGGRNLTISCRDWRLRAQSVASTSARS